MFCSCEGNNDYDSPSATDKKEPSEVNGHILCLVPPVGQKPTPRNIITSSVPMSARILM